METQIRQEQVEETNNEEAKEEEWYLEIPCINLKAKIQEGTTKEVMNNYIGHFEETQKNNGNIGLAAHNRGYENNFFENIQKLNKGDEIYYNYKGKITKYEVETIAIIKDTDWSYLQETQDNRVTLITCVENKPEYRRCVQAKEIKI